MEPVTPHVHFSTPLKTQKMSQKQKTCILQTHKIHPSPLYTPFLVAGLTPIWKHIWNHHPDFTKSSTYSTHHFFDVKSSETPRTPWCFDPSSQIKPHKVVWRIQISRLSNDTNAWIETRTAVVPDEKSCLKCRIYIYIWLLYVYRCTYIHISICM